MTDNHVFPVSVAAAGSVVAVAAVAIVILGYWLVADLVPVVLAATIAVAVVAVAVAVADTVTAVAASLVFEHEP